MRGYTHIVKALAQIGLRSGTLEEAGRRMALAGLKEGEVARYHREWVNEVVITFGQPWFKAIARDPDGAFLDWVGKRLEDPFWVGVRVHDAVRAAHGGDTALLFSTARWQQEIAWARRMRASDNDRIVLLAETWLMAARRDPATLFRRLVDTYVDAGMADPVYMTSGFHASSVEEILDGRVDDRHWRPLWLRFAEREFGRRISQMPRAQLSQTAARIREDEGRERTARSRLRQAARLRSSRPALMLAVLREAAKHALSSDDLVAAERDFIRRLEAGAVDLAAAPLSGWQIFLAELHRWAGYAGPAGADELARRRRAMDRMTPDWANSLPPGYADIGAGAAALMAWFDATMTGARPLPEDPAVDYGLWLAERALVSVPA